MKIAGGILLIVFGVLGICSNLLWGLFFGVHASMSSLVRQEIERGGLRTNSRDAIIARDIVKTVENAADNVAGLGNLGWILAALLLTLGIIVIVTKEKWPAIASTVIAGLYIVLTLSIATGIPALIGGILAIFGTMNSTNTNSGS